MDTGGFYIINKKGQIVELDFNKVLFRLNDLKNREPKLNVNVPLIAQHTIKMMVNGISTKELDDISSKFCASNITNNLDYDKMAVRIEVDNLHRETKECYLETVEDINNYINSSDNKHISLLNDKLITFVKNNYKEINKMLDYSKDYKYGYFGLKTLMKSYLLRHTISKGTFIIKERPQHMLMRVSIGIHLNDIDNNGHADKDKSLAVLLASIYETYNMMSNKYYTHATPTLFNAGTHRQSLSSCFLLSVEDDLKDIYKTLSDTAMISKWSGGIGIHVSQVRAQKSLIRSTNGESEGIVPMLKMFNDSAVYVSQGGGKRKGSTAVYIEPWHADIEDFLDLKKPIGDEMRRARDLFLALWICDVFMERLVKAVQTGETIMWSLFCPDKAKGLSDTYGEEYRKLYHKYEEEGVYEKQVSISDLWTHILEIQMESGVPYISFKDHVNRKNNQNNLGTIKSSNLCVSGDTLILTDTGYEYIEDLEGHEVKVWNGEKFSKTKVELTNTFQKLLKINFSNGAEIKCTDYHRFIVKDKKENKEDIKHAFQLSKGDVMPELKYPEINYSNNTPFSNNVDGFVWYSAGYLFCQELLVEEKVIVAYHSKNILNHVLNYDYAYYDNHMNKYYYMTDKTVTLSNKAPLNKNYVDKVEWLCGVLDACSVISSNNQTFTYHIINSNYKVLDIVRLVCNTLGMSPYINKSKDKLLFSERDTVYMIKKLNISPFVVCHNKKYNKWLDLYDLSKDYKLKEVSVVSVEQIQGRWDTFCFNEPEKNKGVFEGILSMNCNEINIYTDKNNIGVCNLASICLSKFVKKVDSNTYFDYKLLHKISKKAVENLNRVIDNNVYPVKEGEYSDKENRPVGLGVQSLAKVFLKMNLPFVCNESKEINKKIFETIYHAALEMSCELAATHGTYSNYNNSMISKGLLQMDLWNVKPSSLWDWKELRNKIKAHGVRNSLLVALMPTASTAQIMGNTESFEPITSNIFVRNTLSGTFQVVNKYLVKELVKRNLWDEEMKQKIIARDGSVQTIKEVPNDIKEMFKTVWEISQKELINMEADRNAYVCQSTSSNRYLKSPDNAKLTSMHVYEWKKGLKTGMYYLRSQAGVGAVKFNVDVSILNEANKQEEECLSCSA